MIYALDRETGMIPYCLQATFFISFVCSVPSAALTHSVGSLPAFNILLRLPQRQHPGATHKSRPGSCQPSLLFPSHKAHASPVNRCSSFVVSKQSCQTIAAAAIILFINFYGIAAPAMVLHVLLLVVNDDHLFTAVASGLCRGIAANGCGCLFYPSPIQRDRIRSLIPCSS